MRTHNYITFRLSYLKLSCNSPARKDRTVGLSEYECWAFCRRN